MEKLTTEQLRKHLIARQNWANSRYEAIRGFESAIEGAKKDRKHHLDEIELIVAELRRRHSVEE
jgi:hypothetical protein